MIEKTIYLYDPRINKKTKTTYAEAEALTGLKKESLRSFKHKGVKIRSIGCYLIDENTTLAQRRSWYEKEKHPYEAWKPVRGSGGAYLISSCGRFKRVKTNGRVCFLLPYFQNKKNIMRIRLAVDGVYGMHNVANLVAAHFLPAPKPGQVLYHKNGIVTDNYAGNLAYGTRSDVGKKYGARSNSKPVFQFDLDTGEIVGEYRSAREASRMCYLSYQAIQNHLNGRSKTSGGFIFRYEEEYKQEERLG